MYLYIPIYFYIVRKYKTEDGELKGVSKLDWLWSPRSSTLELSFLRSSFPFLHIKCKVKKWGVGSLFSYHFSRGLGRPTESISSVIRAAASFGYQRKRATMPTGKNRKNAVSHSLNELEFQSWQQTPCPLEQWTKINYKWGWINK